MECKMTIDEILVTNLSKYGMIMVIVAGCCYTAYKIAVLFAN